MRKLLRLVASVVVLGAVVFGIVAASRDGKDKNGFQLVAVERGTIVDKALAVGQIVPEQEIQIKSQISGIVKECFAAVGDRVQAGQPLFTIVPDPTPMELTDAERAVQLAEVGFAKAKADIERVRPLFDQGIVARGDLDVAQQAYDQTRISFEAARERLELTREGKIKRAKGGVDSILRAPASGTLLQRNVNPGDPVVPLTSYQAGTALAALADMSKLVFKGTVDEIDVGKLREGLPVRIQIGALPDAKVEGRLRRIAPKAKDKDSATVFDVEVDITNTKGVTLRAGYSSNANIIIKEKKDVLLVPERVVTIEGEKASVELPPAKPGLQPEKRPIKVGLSDGLRLEIVEGLKEGDKVVQRPPKEIK